MKTRTQAGFTLYELLVTMLVAGVLFSIGVPSLLEFNRNSEMTAAANDLLTSILMARSEAVKQRLPVTLCTSPNPVDSAPTCSADGSGTNGGYIVWVDDNGDAAVDAGEQVILQRDQLEDITVFASNGYINFGNTGFLNDIPGLGLSARTLLYCDARGNTVAAGTQSAARAIRVAPTGRGTVIREVAQIAPIVAALGAACP